MRKLCILLSIIFITSSVFAGTANSNKIAKAKCIKAHGVWGTWSKYEAVKNIESCRYKAKDAGKSCIDGNECSVRLCEYEAKTKSGVCPEYSGHNGCHIWMEKGKPQPELCVD